MSCESNNFPLPAILTFLKENLDMTTLTLEVRWLLFQMFFVCRVFIL